MELPEHPVNVKKSEQVSWGPLSAMIVTLLGFFAAQIIGGILLLAIAIIFGGHSIGELHNSDSFLRETKYVFLGNALVSIALLGITYAFIRIRRTRLSAIGLKRFQGVDILYALSGYAVYFLAFIIMNVIIQAKAPELLKQSQDLGFSRETSGLALIPIFASLIILPPLVEETLFRGFLYTGLKKRMPIIGATIITSIVFASAHLLGGETNSLLWIAAADTFILSLVLCTLREKTDRLWASMLVHGMKNFIAFAAIFIFKLS